jgi:hypothetical protein
MDILVDELGQVKCSLPVCYLDKKVKKNKTSLHQSPTHHTNESANIPGKAKLTISIDATQPNSSYLPDLASKM